MRIGIDVDGVIYNTEEELRVYAELYDMLELKQRNSDKNDKEFRFIYRFHWTDEEMEGFMKKYHEEIVKTAHYMPGAKDVLKMLKKDGHELVIITARGDWNENVKRITETRLREDGLDIFDEYYFKIEDKGKLCKDKNIDLMIDDYYKNCQKTAENGINTIYFKAAITPELEESEKLKVLYNWGEIYRYIVELNEKF